MKKFLYMEYAGGLSEVINHEDIPKNNFVYAEDFEGAEEKVEDKLKEEFKITVKLQKLDSNKFAELEIQIASTDHQNVKRRFYKKITD